MKMFKSVEKLAESLDVDIPVANELIIKSSIAACAVASIAVPCYVIKQKFDL